MIKFISYIKAIFFILLLGNIQNFEAQNKALKGIDYIQKLIENDSLNKAKKELKSQLDFYRNQKNTDSLIKYVFLVGSFKLANNNYDIAISKAEAFGKELKHYNNPFVNKEVLLEIAWIYDDAGYTKKSYELVEQAFKIAQNIKDPKKSGLSVIYHNLGYLASNLGDYALSKKQYSKSIKIMEDTHSDDYESYNKTYNALGGVMWYSAKLDSSLYYFNKALKILDKTEKTPINQYYRKALVNSNIAVLNHSLGHIDEAIESSKEVINGYQKYLDTSDDESYKLRALKNQLAAIDNLGSFYHSIGEFERADKLITYSYNKKLKNLAPDDTNLIISQIISAQAKIGLRDFEKANKLIDNAIYEINNSKNTQLFWHASALSTKATISHELGDNNNAGNYYDEAYKLFRKSLGGQDYTRDYLDEIIDMSQFFASQNNIDKAISLAKEGYNFIKTSDFKNTLQEFHHLVNLSEVYYKLKNYNEALKYSHEAINFLNQESITNKTFKDSVQIQYRKPKALLINAQSRYFLNSNKSKSFLNDLLKQLDNGIAILDQRKSTIKSYDDLSLLITENDELFNFSKQLLLDLYQLTHNNYYLNKLITIHESSIYSRIRSRLNLKNDVAFANIPKSVIDKENSIKKKLNTSIEASNDGSFKSFFEANSEWNTFLETLKTNYPKYYKMRYASIEEPLNTIQNNVPENTTIVRYLFINENLYAVVISVSDKYLFKLNNKNIQEYLTQLGENQSEIKLISSKLFELYQQLWKPIENKINTKHVIIIPDGALFNLSFETLTTKKINSFKELANNCLLNKYILSYNYSLLLLDKNRKNVDFQNDFIAFAPEFNDKMKKDYRIAIKDSVEIDKTYLTLLPQPFSVDLAKEYSKLFNGASFVNEKASKQIFEKEASEHKIIHIGTHAESNNINPELSRLIFAKNNADDDNSLYTYEIYNTNLSSNLAILTACETGKPTYQAGEGMISLAHAFNYAGSESILTSLWKIDEQSSAKIIELFYKNIKKGWPKDKALQQAKLDYISSYEGRSLNPQYWAGLVLIGDTSPIEIQSSPHLIFWIVGVFLVITLIWFFVKQRAKSK